MDGARNSECRMFQTKLLGIQDSTAKEDYDCERIIREINCTLYDVSKSLPRQSLSGTKSIHGLPDLACTPVVNITPFSLLLFQLCKNLLTLRTCRCEIPNHVKGTCKDGMSVYYTPKYLAISIPSGRSSPTPLMIALNELMVSLMATNLPSIPVKT